MAFAPYATRIPPGATGRGHAMPDVSGLSSGLLRGKRGLILGLANNRSLAWGIARACHAHGAEIAVTYQGDALKKRVEPLAAEIGARVVGHCDVTDAATIDACFAALEKSWGALDFVVHAVAFSDKDELDGRYVDTTAENFSKTMLISCYSFTAVAKRAEALMKDGGSLLTLTYYGSEKWVPHYNVDAVRLALREGVTGGALLGRRTPGTTAARCSTISPAIRRRSPISTRPSRSVPTTPARTTTRGNRWRNSGCTSRRSKPMGARWR